MTGGAAPHAASDARVAPAAAATRRVWVDGIGLWAPTLPGWAVARAALRGEGPVADPPAKRPAPQLLAPAERRRAPDSVALALEVAAEAVAQSGRAAVDLPSVFVSAHADLGINDYMCSTLVATPTQISPTRFHNSVHNAPAGYWTIGTGCMRTSTALAAYLWSFTAGLLEACTLCAADDTAVLLVGCDVEAAGPLASVNASRGLLAGALVLAPARSDRSIAALDWLLDAAPAAPPAPRSAAAAALTANALADALPVFERLARCDGPAGSGPLALPLAPAATLRVTITPATA